jgi:hypothetical protein
MRQIDSSAVGDKMDRESRHREMVKKHNERA